MDRSEEKGLAIKDNRRTDRNRWGLWGSTSRYIMREKEGTLMRRAKSVEKQACVVVSRGAHKKVADMFLSSNRQFIL